MIYAETTFSQVVVLLEDGACWFGWGMGWGGQESARDAVTTTSKNICVYMSRWFAIVLLEMHARTASF